MCLGTVRSACVYLEKLFIFVHVTIIQLLNRIYRVTAEKDILSFLV